jgi:hypothetical protein
MELFKTYNRPYRKNQVKCVERYCNQYNLSYTNLIIHDGYVTFDGWSNLTYEQLVNQLIAERYTIQDELAIQRKAYNGITDEFHIYNAFVEECKVKAKQFIAERESALNDTNR